MMKHLRFGLVTLIVLLLSACGGSSDSDEDKPASIRLVNLTTAELSMTATDTTVASAVATNGTSSYYDLDSDSYSVVVSAKNSALTTSQAITASLASDTDYSVFAYTKENAVKTLVVTDNKDPDDDVDTNYTLFSVVSDASDAGSLDVFLVPHDADIDDYSAQFNSITASNSSLTQSILSATYDIVVAAAGKKGDDIRLTIPSVTLTSKQITTLLLTGTTGGALVNGALINQGGAVEQNKKADKARVRIVGGFGNDGSTVSATVSGGTALSGLASPAVGLYALVPAGDTLASVSMTSGGTTTAVSSVPSATFASGGDYTILVYGTSAVPLINVLTDDNKASSSSNIARIRLVNTAVATAAGGLSLTDNYVQVVSNVAYGTASAYKGETSGSSQLELTSPSGTWSNYTLFTSTGQLPFLNGSGVYTIFALQASPQVVKLIKDR